MTHPYRAQNGDSVPDFVSPICRPEHRGMILWAVILASSMGFIDSSVTANALPAMRSALGASLQAVAPVNRPRQFCANCGVVEAVNVLEVKGPGSYIGLIAGGLAGAVLGSQVGKGDGKTAAQVLGAAGGAYAGREIEKNVNKSQVFEVVTRLEGGGAQTISFPTDPGYKVGDRVRVENGALVRNL